MKCKNNIFLNLRPLFLRNTFLNLWHFFSPSAYPINSFFSGISNRSYDNSKNLFSLFSWQPLLGKQILSSQYAGYQSKLLKNCQKKVKQMIQTDKDYSKKQIVAKVAFSTPMLRTQNLTMGSKYSESSFFEFLLPLVIYMSGFDLLNMSYFS